MVSLTAASLIAGAAAGAVKQGLDKTGSLMGRLSTAAGSGTIPSSLTDLSKPSRVQPLVVIDSSLGDEEHIVDVMRTVLSIFTGYYIQGVNSIMPVGRVDTMKILDALNPDRSMLPHGLSGLKDHVWSKEAFANGLPSLEAMTTEGESRLIVSIEKQSDAEPGMDAAGDLKRVYESENLAVGKLVNINVTDGDKSAKIPVTIRLVPSRLPSSTITHIFTAVAGKGTWSERWHLWRAGQISFVKDLIFSKDLIDAHRKALINDTSNVYMSMSSRKSWNTAVSAKTGTPSLADASNILVISKETSIDIGRKLGGKLDSVRIRRHLFDSTNLMLLVVVDDQRERVVIYHRGLDLPTDSSFREIKSSEKGKGPDITEILKAYSMGATPTI